MIDPNDPGTPRLPLDMTIGARSASTAKDSRLVNYYVETLKDGTKEIVSRPGTVAFGTTTTGAGTGLVSFNGKIYAVVNATLYELSSLGVATSKGTVGTGAKSFSRTSQVPYLYIHNGTAGYTLNGSTGNLVAISDLDYPPNQTPALPLANGAVYLDDMVFVMTTSGRIYNSAVEDPTSWGALDYISKISEPDGGVALAKHLNFIVAWGEWSGEFFYNAGIATGSPLERSSSYKMDIGCAAGTSVVELDQSVMWIGQSREAGRRVYLMDGVTPVPVSSPAIERFLNASTLASVEGAAVKIAGHLLYVFTLNDLNLTFVYDISEKEWYQWSTQSGSTDIEWQYAYLTSHNGKTYALDRATGEIDYLSTTTHTDNGAIRPCRIVTYKTDLRDNKIKFWSHAELVGNRSAATMQLRFSDDDYGTWSAYRSVSLDQERPIWYQLGQSRRRAWEIYSESAVEIRLRGLEFNVTKGTF